MFQIKVEIEGPRVGARQVPSVHTRVLPEVYQTLKEAQEASLPAKAAYQEYKAPGPSSRGQEERFGRILSRTVVESRTVKAGEVSSPTQPTDETPAPVPKKKRPARRKQ